MKCNQKFSGHNILPSAQGFSLIRLFFVATFMTLGFEAIGQEASKTAPATFPELNIPTPDNADVSAAASKMELVIWFMGNRPSAPVGSEQESSTTVGKKSFINSGMKPNRTLIKSFLKKAVNYDNTLV